MTNQGCVSKVRIEHDLCDCSVYSAGKNSMVEGQFATWELTKQRESITPANLWTVTRITEDREELACIEVHGKSGTEVPGTPLTGTLVHSFGFWLSFKKGLISKTNRALVQIKFPNSFVVSLQETIDQMR